MDDLLRPVSNVRIVDRNLLKPNDYNPNKVTEENLKLLTQSILVNGWTLPIVCRPDYTINEYMPDFMKLMTKIFMALLLITGQEEHISLNL